MLATVYSKQWQARAMATATAVSAMCGPVRPVAAALPRYPPRVKAVLEYVARHPSECPPLGSIAMEYDRCPSAPVEDVVLGLSPEDVLPRTKAAQPSLLPPGANSASSGDSDSDRNHWAAVVAGLLYLSVGGVDQAHNLVTPLCWAADTSYGGPPIHGSPAARAAAYAHALVHRIEGLHDGEAGSGLSNSNYWSRAADAEHFDVVAGPLLAAAKHHAAGDAALEQHVAGHGVRWNPPRFVALVSQALKTKDPKLLSFCQSVAADEWRLLFDHCWSQLVATNRRT